MGILFSIYNYVKSNTIRPTIENTPEPIPEPTPEPIHHNCIFTPKGEKKGVIVGINYQDNDSSDDDLNGCVEDTIRLKNYLTKCCYFNEEDITLVCEPYETTKNEIQKQLRELVFFSYTHHYSELWFSFSGHGGGVYNTNEDDEQCEVICPSDYKQNGVIVDYWLKTHFINRLHPTSKLFILMDCCHSGTNLNLPYQLIDKKETLLSNPNVSLLARVIKISGCRDDQTSMEYYDDKSGEYQGALTSCFLANANEYRGTVFNVLCDNVRNALENKGFQQKPMLSFSRPGDSSWSLV